MSQPYNANWTDLARRELHRLACTRARLTSDDLWDVMRRSHPGVPLDSDPRSIASLFQEAAKDRWIEKTPHYQPSRDKVCHGRPKRVWASLLHGRTLAEQPFPAPCA